MRFELVPRMNVFVCVCAVRELLHVFRVKTPDLNTNDNHVSIAVNKIGCVPKSIADMSIPNINGELDHH